MSLCKYKDLFGIPNEGVHKYRTPILNLAIVDVISTILGSILISYYTKYSFVIILIYLFILSIVLHKIFCVKTQVNTYLFG